MCISTDTPGRPPSLVIKAAVVTESTFGFGIEIPSGQTKKLKKIIFLYLLVLYEVFIFVKRTQMMGGGRVFLARDISSPLLYQVGREASMHGATPEEYHSFHQFNIDRALERLSTVNKLQAVFSSRLDSQVGVRFVDRHAQDTCARTSTHHLWWRICNWSKSIILKKYCNDHHYCFEMQPWRNVTLVVKDLKKPILLDNLFM